MEPKGDILGAREGMPLAVVLAGGLGTRLRPLTHSIPKPLVKVAGKPFLGYVLKKLAGMGIGDVVLLTGYKHDMIEKYCRNGDGWGLGIRYSVEREQLGTGGAILAARGLISRTALVLNADTYLDLELGPFLAFHKSKRALATVLVMEGELSGRGAVLFDAAGRVRSFLEKEKEGRGAFNTGAYLIEPAALGILSSLVAEGRLEAKFSMERNGFPKLIEKNAMYAYRGKGKFLDIGTFAALEKAGGVVG